jgi:hypothetical protein
MKRISPDDMIVVVQILIKNGKNVISASNIVGKM